MEGQAKTGRSPRRQVALVLPLLLLVASLAALLLAWDRSPSGPAQAVATGPGMTLSVVDTSRCEGPDDNPTSCTFPITDPPHQFTLTVIANPAPSVAIAGFASEVFFPVAPEAGGCDNIADDDGDLAVNDGCPLVGPVSEGQCGNDRDDDGDNKVNDGCLAVGSAETNCANNLDDDNDGAVNDGCPPVGDAPEQDVAKAPTCINTVDDDGDLVVNDGCPQVGDAGEGELEFCTNDLDDDGDGVINDGCPQVGGQAETGDQCTNDTDDDPDFGGAVPDGVVNDGCPPVGAGGEDPCTNAIDDDNDGFPNDGCPVEGSTEATGCDGSADDDRDGVPNDGCPQQGGTAEAGSLCADSTDDDADGFINDGCGTAGSAPESGAQCANATDDDGDGRTNDGCPPAGAELVWTPRPNCTDEVQVTVGVDPPAVCIPLVTSVGAAGHSVVSALGEAPLPALGVSTGTVLLELDFTCNIQGSHTIALLASPDSSNGAVYTDTGGFPIFVKTVEQQLDLDFDGTPEPHQVADTLEIICGTPPEPTPTPTATLPPGVTPTDTPTPTITPTPCPEGEVPTNGACGTPTPSPTPCPEGEVPTNGACGTPTPSPTPCPAGEVPVDGACGTPTPTPIDTPVGATPVPTAVICEEPDVTVTKSDSPDPVVSAGTLTYTLLVRNLCQQKAENVVVKDTLPAGSTFLSAPPLGCAHVAGVVTCTLPSLAANDSQPGGFDEQSIVIQVVAPTLQVDGRIVNEVDVSAGNEPIENTGNNHAVEETVVLGERPDLTVEKTGAPSFLSFESVERTLTYTVTVRNIGPVEATGVMLEDTLPPADQATFDSAAGCTHAARLVTCPLGSLAAGGETSVTIAVTVPATTQDLLLRNEARVSAANEPFWATGNNLAVAHTPVIAPPPDLDISKTDSEDPVLRARLYSYTVTVTNSGGGDALDVVLTDPLDASLTFVSFVSDDAECSLAPGNVVTCTIPEVPANDGQVDGQVVITINVRAPTVNGDLSLTNDVTVVDLDENLELSASETTEIQACFDITGDGAVAFADVLALLVVFGSSITDQQSQEKLTIIDFNGDGSISFLDFLQLVQHYGQVC